MRTLRQPALFILTVVTAIAFAITIFAPSINAIQLTGYDYLARNLELPGPFLKNDSQKN